MPELECPACRENFAVDDGPAARPLMQQRPFFPFCSERCKMVDLGHWFEESYKIDRPVMDQDLPDELGENF